MREMRRLRDALWRRKEFDQRLQARKEKNRGGLTSGVMRDARVNRSKRGNSTKDPAQCSLFGLIFPKRPSAGGPQTEFLKGTFLGYSHHLKGKMTSLLETGAIRAEGGGSWVWLPFQKDQEDH